MSNDIEHKAFWETKPKIKRIAVCGFPLGGYTGGIKKENSNSEFVPHTVTFNIPPPSKNPEY